MLRLLDGRHVQLDSECVNERPQVPVPIVVGLTVLAGRRTADEAHLVLAPANADGPPLAVLLWPHESEYVIASQSPDAGECPARRQCRDHLRENQHGVARGGWGQGATSTQASTWKLWCCSSA